jgi:hypothetical protein
MYVIICTNVDAREYEEANCVYGPFNTKAEAVANLVAVVCLHKDWKVISERVEQHPFGPTTYFQIDDDDGHGNPFEIEVNYDADGDANLALLYGGEEAAVIEPVHAPVKTN